MSEDAAARRGDVGIVQLDHAEGHEMKKVRPAVVVQNDRTVLSNQLPDRRSESVDLGDRLSRCSTLFRSRTDVTDFVYFVGSQYRYSVVVSCIRATTTFNSSNDHSVFVPAEGDRKTELTDTHLTT